MRSIIITLLIVCCTTACNNDEPPLPPEKLQAILLDLHFAEGYSMMVTDSTHFLREKNKDSLAVFYNDVLKHHNVPKDKFLETMEWYKRHPEELDSVYARMLPELGKLESLYP